MTNDIAMRRVRYHVLAAVKAAHELVGVNAPLLVADLEKAVGTYVYIEKAQAKRDARRDHD